MVFFEPSQLLSYRFRLIGTVRLIDSIERISDRGEGTLLNDFQHRDRTIFYREFGAILWSELWRITYRLRLWSRKLCWIYSHITSISCTCVACPQGAGRDAWHTYSPVSFRFTWETSKLLFEYILTLSGGSCRGSPLSARRMPSLHHLTLVCTLSRHMSLLYARKRFNLS